MFVRSSPPSSNEKIKILVLGDSGTGKTSLVNLICKERTLQNPTSTVGCNLEVKLHDQIDKQYFVEFFDIGAKSKYENSRNIFYPQTNGVILVYDMTNKNSYLNLKKWMAEFLTSTGNSWTEQNQSRWKSVPSATGRFGLGREFSQFEENDAESGNNFLEFEYDHGMQSYLPVLIIGNKSDLIEPSQLQAHQQPQTNACVSSLNPSAFVSGSSGFFALDAFLNRVIQRRFNWSGSSRNYPSVVPQSSPASKKFSHLDPTKND
mmetsp:Transcript_19009/g.26594  ORF Transcript_19009/g.26594 Transcript_19009/m.26594 type:complete len:262 (-) Transcript_19009:536-1321(-)